MGIYVTRNVLPYRYLKRGRGVPMPVVNLTAKFVEAAVAREGRRLDDYFDTNMPGLLLRVSMSGVKSWNVMYRVHGRQRRLTLGRYPHLSLADARDEAREAMYKVHKGIDPAEIKLREKTEPMFTDFAAEFIERHAKARKRGEETARIIERELLKRWRYRRAKDITRRDVIDLLDEIAARAPIMANRVLAVVRKMYNWGIGRDIVDYNPCIQVKRPGKEQQRERVLKPSEIRTLWASCDKLGCVMGNFFRMRLATAQRGQEVCQMRWQDIEDAWWTIPSTVAKNGLSHRVPLSGLAQSLLAELQNTSQWVFPSPTLKGEPISAYQKAFQRLREATEIDDIRSHDLRRTAASYMTSLGVSRLVVSKILNHVETGVTAVYDRHSYDAEKRQALDLWADHLGKLAKGELDGSR